MKLAIFTMIAIFIGMLTIESIRVHNEPVVIHVCDDCFNRLYSELYKDERILIYPANVKTTK